MYHIVSYYTAQNYLALLCTTLLYITVTIQHYFTSHFSTLLSQFHTTLHHTSLHTTIAHYLGKFEGTECGQYCSVLETHNIPEDGGSRRRGLEGGRGGALAKYEEVGNNRNFEKRME